MDLLWARFLNVQESEKKLLQESLPLVRESSTPELFPLVEAYLQGVDYPTAEVRLRSAQDQASEWRDKMYEEVKRGVPKGFSAKTHEKASLLCLQSINYVWSACALLRLELAARASVVGKLSPALARFWIMFGNAIGYGTIFYGGA